MLGFGPVLTVALTVVLTAVLTAVLTVVLTVALAVVLTAVLAQGKCQLLHPAPPYYPFPRGKFHTRSNIWSLTVG